MSWSPVGRVCFAGLVLTLVLSCKDKGNGGADAAPPRPVEPPVEEVKIEKSAELRFAEANAALMCFERANKRAPKDKEREDLLRPHGFAGKTGGELFKEFSIRGEKDPDWGKDVAAKIRKETELLCPVEGK